MPSGLTRPADCKRAASACHWSSLSFGLLAKSDPLFISLVYILKIRIRNDTSGPSLLDPYCGELHPAEFLR